MRDKVGVCNVEVGGHALYEAGVTSPQSHGAHLFSHHLQPAKWVLAAGMLFESSPLLFGFKHCLGLGKSDLGRGVSASVCQSFSHLIAKGTAITGNNPL